MKWNSESRIKSIIYADNYIPQHQYFKVPKYKKENWNVESKIDASQNYGKADNDNNTKVIQIQFRVTLTLHYHMNIQFIIKSLIQ